SLGAGLLSVRQERRTYPITAELGVTNRLSVSLTVPIVRVATRSSLNLSTTRANLGLNPRLTVSGADAAYLVFFTQFDTTLARFEQNINAGLYGCGGNAACAARDSLAFWRSVRDALDGTGYGVASVGSLFMPLDSSPAGRGIDSAVARIRRDMSAFGVAGFDTTFLLPTDTLSGALLQAAIVDSAIGFGYNRIPFRSGFRYGFGDVELAAKYRLVAGAHYAAAVQALVRLPIGARDSADELLAQSIGDHQTDLEGQLTQELSAGPLWLNVAVRAAVQRPGMRVRRVAPPDAFLVPAAATASLRWDPGDYVGVDVAPLVRLAPEFAVGFTAGYWTKQLGRMAERALHVGITQHARQLARPRLPGDRPHVAGRHTTARPLGHDQLVAGICRDLGKVRDDESLAALVARDRGQRLAHSRAHLPADALVHLGEHERRHGVVLRQHDFERQHETRQLATRGHLGERSEEHTA